MIPSISQLRLDFIHFNLAQPHRRTGVCQQDVFSVAGGAPGLRTINLCGTNSGQHIYYDVENSKQPVTISLNMSGGHLPRMWEIRVSQIEFRSRAPPGCLQYFHGPSGVIQTMNYAVNGRHLANQDYNICIRQEAKMCSVAYEPCDDNSFKIGAPASVAGPLPPTPLPATLLQDSEVEGSGDGDSVVVGAAAVASDPVSPAAAVASSGVPPSLAVVSSDVPPSLTPDPTLTPVLPPTPFCNDRVVMPCDIADDFLPGNSGGVCDLLRCGETFCRPPQPCRIESSVKPFNLRVMFGDVREEDPEDNIGMCLRYEQQPCA